MRTLLKTAIVTATHVASYANATVIIASRVFRTNGLDRQASAGMPASVNGRVFLKFVGPSALLPTAAAFSFLRLYARFGPLRSTFGVPASASGLVAILISVFAFQSARPGLALSSWAEPEVLRLLPVRFLAVGVFRSAACNPIRISPPFLL